jgi:ParB-like chromosome segregation protein Spo0J
MKLSDIRLNKENPRTISDENLEKLANSINEFPKMMADE